jgi:hypothetical protein
MTGKLASVLLLSWREVFLPLSRGRKIPKDLFNALVEGVWRAPVPPQEPVPPPPEAYNELGELIEPHALAALQSYEARLLQMASERKEYEAAVSSMDARPYFKRLLQVAAREEGLAVTFVERCYQALEGLDEGIRDKYGALGREFLVRHNLRYEARDGFSLYPTVPGMFAELLSELRLASAANLHTQTMFQEFEEAFRDLKAGRTEARLKTCLQREFNLLEALGRAYPGVTHHTLGQICEQLDWPHATIKEVGKKLYGFRSDYPGVGHAGNPASVLRPIGTKDFVSISLMLAAISPYFVQELNGERCYIA